MTSHTGETHAGKAVREPESLWAFGWTGAAAVLMIFAGAMGIVEGIAATARDRIFIVSPTYSYSWTLTGWGWLQFSLGVLVLIAGLSVMSGAVWARTVGVVLAGFELIVNFMWLPFAPIWSLVLLTINGFIIWGLCAPRHEVWTPPA